MIIVSERNKLIRHLTLLVPQIAPDLVKLVIVESPTVLANRPYEIHHVLLIDVPTSADEELQDEFVIESRIWLQLTPGALGIAILPPDFEAVKQRLGKNALMQVITERQAFSDDYWEKLFVILKADLDRRALVEDVRRAVTKVADGGRWAIRAPLLLRVLNHAKTEGGAEQVALRVAAVRATSRDQKNAARQKLFHQLRAVGAPPCKTILTLARLGWVWKLRHQGKPFSEIARELNCRDSDHLRMSMRKQVRATFGDVDRIPYEEVLNAVTRAFVAEHAPSSAADVFDPILTKLRSSLTKKRSPSNKNT